MYLQSAVAAFPDYDLNIEDDTKSANIRRTIVLIAKIPTLVAAWNRIRKSQNVVEPLEEGSHARNFLYMLRGKEPSQQEAKIFDMCLILHAEHQL